MKTLTLVASAAVMAATMSAATAQAAVFTVSFTDYSSTINLNATITTSNTLNAVSGYDITAITGTVSGNPGSDPITGLVINPNQPNAWGCCGFIVDNVLFSPGQTFDNWGVLFDTIGGRYNFWMNSATEGELYTYGAPHFLDVRGAVAAAPAGVAEPDAWALMILGFGGVGALLRTRRQARGAVTA